MRDEIKMTFSSLDMQKEIAVLPDMDEAIEGIRRMFVDKVQHDHIVNENQTPAKRAAFIKQHGSAHGVFHVDENIEEKYRVGIFQPGMTYEAWVRYSSDVPDERPDKNSTVGIGIKIFDVCGEKCLEEDIHCGTLDFILQNTEVFFASDAIEMHAFKSAALDGTLDQFLQSHPETARILEEMSSRTVNSVLTEPLWSCVPYKFGDEDYCKFKLAPQSVPEPAFPYDINDPDYLADDLRDRLQLDEVRLDFYVQLRNDPLTQSIESARSLWEESKAIPVKVATLILPRQNILARGQGPYGETLSYNIWRTLPALAPVGSIAEARKVVYRSSAQTRRDVNGQPTGEPTRARPPLAPTPPYETSFQNPWPSENSFALFENFKRFNETAIQPGKHFDTGRLKIWNNSKCENVNIAKSACDSRGMVLRVDNADRLSGIVEIMFDTPLENINFSFSSVSKSLDGGKIFALPLDGVNIISEPYIIKTTAGNLHFSSNYKGKIDKVVMHFNETLENIEIYDLLIEG